MACTQLRFVIDHAEVERDASFGDIREALQDIADEEGTEVVRPRENIVVMRLQVKGKRPVSDLVSRLIEIDGVIQVGHVQDEDIE
jgi:putative Mg2+ transporter-C (MgtC) family protein